MNYYEFYSDVMCFFASQIVFHNSTVEQLHLKLAVLNLNLKVSGANRQYHSSYAMMNDVIRRR